MFFFFNKNNTINTTDLLLDTFKEKGVVKIIQGYKDDLENMDERIGRDEFEIQKTQETLKKMKSKTKGNFYIRLCNNSHDAPHQSFDLRECIGVNNRSLKHWNKRIEVYNDLLRDSVKMVRICESKSEARKQCHERWFDVANQWEELSQEYSALCKEIAKKADECRNIYDTIDVVLRRQLTNHTNSMW